MIHPRTYIWVHFLFVAVGMRFRWAVSIPFAMQNAGAKGTLKTYFRDSKRPNFRSLNIAKLSKSAVS
jgi:hypothetical protein